MVSMREFPETPLTAVIDQAPLYNLAESIAANLQVADLFDPGELADVTIGYAASPGDPALRELIAGRLGVPAGQVLITSGAAANRPGSIL
jgi:DNA-binding transcriptional MocR family regulator